MQIIRCSNPPPTAWVHSTVGSCDVTADVCWASVWHLWNHLQPWPADGGSLQPPAGVITSPLTSLLTSPSGNISPLPSHRSGNFSTPSYHLTVLEISNLTAHLTLLETSPLYQLPPHCSGNISTSSERNSRLTSPF